MSIVFNILDIIIKIPIQFALVTIRKLLPLGHLIEPFTLPQWGMQMASARIPFPLLFQGRVAPITPLPELPPPPHPPKAARVPL